MSGGNAHVFAKEDDEVDFEEDTGERKPAKKSETTDLSCVSSSKKEKEAGKTHPKHDVRNFVKVKIEVETIGGNPLIFTTWASKNKLSHKKKHLDAEVPEQAFSCSVCKKNFLFEEELELHTKHYYSKNLSCSRTFYTCSICEKKFDEQRKLTLHFRYHKINTSSQEHH